MTDGVKFSIKITCMYHVSCSCQQILNNFDVKEKPNFVKVIKPTGLFEN